MKTSIKYTALSFAITLAACSSVNENTGEMKQHRQEISETVVSEDETFSTATINDSSLPAAKSERALVAIPRPAKEKKASGLMPMASQHLPQATMLQGASDASSFIGYAPQPIVDRENYHTFKDNGLIYVSDQPVSTFSIDVDTGSYSNVRRFLNQGQLPRKDAVRIEELVNYFNYGYQAPNEESTPFSVYTELAPSPWNQHSKLLHIGLQGYDVPAENLPPANLVFLIDVSGSMSSENKIGLLKKGFRLLTNKLRAQDTISIAVYAGASGVVLEPTSGEQKHKILSAIDNLSAGGSTNGAAGINLAYQLAKSNYKEEGVNRVILATDGDFNVGTVNFESLVDMVEQKRKGGIALTTLGFGSGNYNDHLMEQLADKGNGNYAYIDNIQEARKVLVEEIGSTLKTIAKDVKIQIEFNPSIVKSYRLIGYENRALKREDFNNDKIDAGEIGAGHTVTAIYELDLVNGTSDRVDPLRYGSEGVEKITKDHYKNGEIAFLKLRYKKPNEDKSLLVSTPIKLEQGLRDLANTSEPFRFSAAVAAFGQMLRGGDYLGEYGYQDIIDLGVNSKGNDPMGYRSEFINLVRLAKELEHGSY